MRTPCAPILRLTAAASLCFATISPAASISDGLGYTNDFSSQPPAADWATRAFGSAGQTGAGEITSAATLDAAVQTNSASLFTSAVGTSTANPPNTSGTALWSSTGFYLQTRPTANAATLLMTKLVNNSTTNATSIRITYDYATNRAASVVEEVRGHRVYYSLTGAANSWSNIAALSSTAQGTLDVDLQLAETWAIGGTLYLLWADDNGSGTPDDPNDIDNFYATISGGMPLSFSCSLVAPANGRSFPDTNAVTLTANVSPGPGATGTGVGYYEVSRGFLGSALAPPYTINTSLVSGSYQLYAVASNSLGAIAFSATTNTITVTNVPFSLALLSPTNGTTHGTPTNVTFSAAPYGGSNAVIIGVGFYEAASGLLASAVAAPYSTNVSFGGGTFSVYAVATNSLNATVASATNTMVINVPPINSVAPTIFTQNPLHSTPLTNFTSMTVTFSEPVVGVTASDLLVNGVPATGVTGSGTNYTFTFPRPAYGEVAITWASDHGITDFGWPTVLPFDGTGPGAQWGYYLFDQTPPGIAARVPAANATVTNLEQIVVTFTEAVTGVDASDLLLNGTPALAVGGSGSNHIFNVTPPVISGPLTMSVSWATNHAITDLTTTPNAFNRTNAGWSFTLDVRTPLIQSNSFWFFVKGTGEASTPTNAWRELGFDTSGWSNAPAPFFYGDPYSNGLPAFTLLYDMQSNYSTIYLRKEFTVANRSAITNLYLAAQADDGFVAWLNGVEVRRVNAPAGEVPYNGVATTQSTEPQNNGSAYVSYLLTNAAALLVNGQNVLAIHALNQSLTASSDFGFNAQLYTYIPDLSAMPPRLAQASPAPGEVLSLSSLTITFSEGVIGVDAGDLLVNGIPASSVSTTNDSIYTFTFAQPPAGPVAISWTGGHGIVDFDSPPKAFDGAAAGNTLTYSLLNPGAPIVTGHVPSAGATVSNLTGIVVIFNETVTGVDAADLLVNGIPASGVTGLDSTYAFTFPQPAYGPVAITWAASTGIQDLDAPANTFDGSRPTNRWSYTLLDRDPPSVASQNPPAGAVVINLTQLTVTFTEPVAGVNASDLLINGLPATGVTGSGGTYTFTFPQPNSDFVLIGWASGHGIRDLAVTPNAFAATGPEDNWHYLTVDNVSPAVAVYPPPSATVRRLNQLTVTFDEFVTGVNAGDLLINNTPAQQVADAGAGAYRFTFTQPPTGAVQMAFAQGHGIQDGARPPNAFGGAAWSYRLDPSLPIDVAVSHVIQMSFDGLASKYLAFYLTNAPEQFPNFVRLTHEGAFTLNARCDFDISETIPNHLTMFTGRPVFQPNGQPDTVHHGYNNNFPAATDTVHNSGNTNVPYKFSMFDNAHDYGRTTAFFAGKTRLGICDRSYNETNGAPDLIGADNGRDKIDFASVLDISGASISNEVNEVVAELTSASPKHYLFVHIAEPDLTGHGSSWGSTAWSNMVRTVDTQLGRILNAIDSNPALANQTALIITADHGGGGVTPNAHTEAHHVDNYSIPFFLRAPGIAGGTDLYTLFANRGNPGTNRTDYTTQPQPVRDGDGSNLALSLLGLPPIPGSFMAPSFAAPGVSLRIARFGSLTTVFWYDPSDAYVLEASEALSGSTWQPIITGITVSESTKVYTINAASGEPTQFFRLRAK